MTISTPQIQFRNEFIASFERNQSLIRDTATTEAVIKGNQAVFLVAGSGGASASSRGSNGLIPSRQDSTTQYTATLVEKHDLVKYTDFDIFSAQGNQREIMQKSSMAVINRTIDDAIIAELNTATNSNTTAAPVTYNAITSSLANLYQNDVPNDGNIFALITPKFHAKLLQISEFGSADYVDIKPISAGTPTQSVRPQLWLNVKWVMHTGLPGMGTASETCLFYHKSAIGHAVNTNGIDVAMGRDDEQAYQFVRSSINHGAKLLQNNGVYKFLHNATV